MSKKYSEPVLSGMTKGISGVRRAVIYLRVSTQRQADGEVSIPSQRHLCEQYCATRGYQVVAEFQDAATGKDDRARPQFRKMLAAARQNPPTFDVIIVHALNRFYRNGPVSELTIRDLAKNGVAVESVTQTLSDDPNSVIDRQVIQIFDEYSSLQNSVNVTRGMAENARQGFWNGARPPLGYRSIVSEVRGKKLKKRLEIEPTEAELVRLIFRMYADGAGGRPPLGIAALVAHLNNHGYRTRLGARFGKGAVSDILRAEYYVSGQFHHGRGKVGDSTERKGIPIPVPAIIEQDLFDRVQAKLARNHPRMTPPRVTNGPILLSGLARCVKCNSAMTRTGTARGDKQYSYYTCSGAHGTAQPECRSFHVPMERLDAQVTEAVLDRLVRPEMLGRLLAEISSRRSNSTQRAQERVATLRAAVDGAEGKLRRLYRLAEADEGESDDILAERMRELRAELDRTRRALDLAKAEVTPSIVVDAERIGRFSQLVTTALREGDIQNRRTYLQSIIDRIEVDRKLVRIVGRKSALEAVVAGRPRDSESVRGFDQEWRTRHDSNV